MARQSKPLSDAIIETLQRDHLMTAPQILDTLNTESNQYNKTSVYRALDKLLADNAVCKQNFGDNEIRYELRDTHHDHLVCQTCSSITAVPCTITPPTNLMGFLVDHHHATYFGECERCQLKKSIKN